MYIGLAQPIYLLQMIGLANSKTKNHIEIYLKIEICVRFVVWQELKLAHKSVVVASENLIHLKFPYFEKSKQ